MAHPSDLQFWACFGFQAPELARSWSADPQSLFWSSDRSVATVASVGYVLRLGVELETRHVFDCCEHLHRGCQRYPTAPLRGGVADWEYEARLGGRDCSDTVCPRMW